jgi:hypothetical protein
MAIFETLINDMVHQSREASRDMRSDEALQSGVKLTWTYNR